MWSFIKWLGRVCLWLLFFPVGLWASIAHGRRKRARLSLQHYHVVTINELPRRPDMKEK